MASKKDDELGIDVTADFKKFEAQLGAVYKRIQSKGVVIKVGVNIDPKAAQELAAFQKQIGEAFKGTNQNAQVATQQLQGFFSAVSRGTNSLAKNAGNFGTLGAQFKAFARDLSNAKLNQKNAQDIGKFFRDVSTGGNTMLRVTKNVDAMVAAINKLIGRLQILQKTGQLDLLRNLPGNMGFTEKGGIRMQPIKIVAPNEAEWNAIKGQIQNRIAAKPIKAKIEPEMSGIGMQRFQNLLIALSFGQFSQSLERMSRQIISSYSSIEQAQVTLRTVYRDKPQRAEQVYQYLTDKEAKTPFKFDEMLQGGTQFAVQEKQLKKYGFDVERSVNMATELAAAFGQGKPGSLQDIQTGISRLTTGDQNGFEILDKYGISRSTLRESGLAVGKTGVSLKSDSDIQAVLEAIERFQMKTTGGNLAERQNQTVGGQISNVESQLMKTQASLLAPLEDSFRQLLGVSSDFLKALETAPEIVRGFIGTLVLGGTLFMKAAQQVSSVGLLFLGANNAGLFDGLKKGVVNTATNATGAVVAGGAGGAVAAGAGAGLIARLFPTFGPAIAGMFEAIAGLFSSTLPALAAAFLETAVGGIVVGIATTVAGMAAAAGAAFMSTILGPITLLVGGVALAGVALSGLGAAFGYAADFIGGIPKMVDEFLNKDRRDSEAFTEKWNGKSPEAQKRRAKLATSRQLSEMTGSEIATSETSKQSLTDAIAINMEKQRDIRSKKMTPESEAELKALDKQLVSLLNHRSEYNNLKKTSNDLTEVELKQAKNLNQIALKLGQITQAQYANSLNKTLLKRLKTLKEAEETKDPNKIALAQQDVAEIRAEIYDENQKTHSIERDHIKNAADLSAATGGSSSAAINYGYAEASLMPNLTEPDRIAQESKLNSIHGLEYQQKQAGRNAGIDARDASGDTLGAQIARIQMDKEESLRAVGTEKDRIQITHAANQKILQARYDFYQQILKLAQDNLSGLQAIENQRIQTAKTINESALGLMGTRQGRKDIESQLSSNPEMEKLALRQQDLILKDTRSKLSQAKARYDLDIESKNKALENMRSKKETDPALISKAERDLQLRKEAYRGEKQDIRANGASSLDSTKEAEKNRNEDLKREAAQTKLEAQAESLRIQKDKIDADMGKSKEKYVDLLKQQLKLELDALKVKYDAAILDTKLTKAQRDNLKAQYDNDVAATQTKYGGSASASKVAGYQAKINTYKSAAEADPNMKPQAKLMNLKKQLDLEKAILFEKLKQDMAKPGADATSLQKNYLSDLNNLQLQYLDSAKKVTGEIEAQNAALIARYNNTDSKSGMFAGGFSMGEVFGVDELGANLQMDSEYSQMKYKQMGTNGAGSSKGGFDPFSKDKWDVKDYANSAKTDAYGDDKLGKIPGNMKELEKINLAAEYTLKVVAPDGVTTTFKNAYNGPVGNGKGTI